MKKILAILLAMVMVLAVSLPAFATDGSYPDPVDIRAIPGIDYNRITQKATKGKQSHQVELKMGDLSFIGELVGSHGLTFEEINAIINEVLKEMDLTADRIALVSKLAGQAEEDAKMYFWDQVLEGLMSYIPAPPGIDIGDYYAYIVHGEQKPLDHEQNFTIGMAILLAEQAINEDIADGYGAIGKFFQRYDKVLFGKGTANVPLSYIVKVETLAYLGAEVRDRATKKAVLESSLAGMFTVEIETEGKKTIYGEMDGAFDIPGSINFVFEHDVSIYEGLIIAPTDEKLDGSLFSNDINGLTATGRLFNDYVSHTDLPMSVGTLWDPIESEPILTVK